MENIITEEKKEDSIKKLTTYIHGIPKIIFLTHPTTQYAVQTMLR